MGKRDYYEILQVSRQSDEEEIKKSTGSLRSNTIPTGTLTIRRPRRNSRKLAEAYEVLHESSKKAPL